MMQTHTNARRVLSFIMVLAMVLSILPASVFSADTGTTVYLKPNANWQVANARFAVYYWTSDADAHWVNMTDTDGDGYYEAVIPAGYSNIIFCRMNPSIVANNWDDGTMWDKTNDLTLPTNGNNCYTVAEGAWSMGNGTWSTYTPGNSESSQTATYFVAGTPTLCGSDWTVNDPANQMTMGDNGLYTITYKSVYPGTHKFKITDGTWTNNWGNGDDADGNTIFTLDAISDVTITFNANTKAITASSTPTGEVAEYVNCTITIHFANTGDWGNLCLYTWTTTDGELTGSWPGSKTAQDANGFYTYSTTVKVMKNQPLNLIVNNGGNGLQTADLSISAAEVTSGTVEKWVQLGSEQLGEDGKGTGKYNATLYDNAGEVVQGPVVNGTSVTFTYKNPDAQSVRVFGSMNNWSADYVMSKNEYGVWTVTIDNLSPGTHRYKFVVDGDWILDDNNNWKYTESDNDRTINSAFIILDPDAEDTNKVTVRVHFHRENGTAGWNLWTWSPAMDGTQFDFTTEGNEQIATITLTDARAHTYINFKPRYSTEENKWAAEMSQFTVDLSNIVSGTVDYYVNDSVPNGMRVLNIDVKLGNKVSSAELDYDTGKINISTTIGVANPAEAFTIVQVIDGQETTMKSTVVANGTVYSLTLTDVELTLVNLYQYKIKYDGYTYDIGINTVYASDKFAAEFTYNGKDLGANWSKDSTTFILWAPTASAVSVALYPTGNDSAATATHNMIAGEDGVWYVTVKGDLNRVYYTYLVERDGITVEAVDPYARTTGVNGQRGMVIDLDSTDPTGWENDKNPNHSTSYTDAIIYELHVRDFSIDDSFGAPVQFEDYMGKFLAFTLKGTTVNGEGNISTGIDYLKKLGVTHIHLLPIYDYGSVDETKCDNFNWGYDPVNYNVPEGSYSTDPYKGEMRVNEMKQMIQALHDAGISVIMDVVYNHVYDSGKFCFNQIVPGYFSRPNSNTSGCGNDTASEREMVSKYIVESVTYWCEEYHIDGFRFDLVGLIDVNTINAIIDSVHNGLGREDVIFYGEGWDMDGTNKEDGTEMAKQGNASKTPEFGYFSDTLRNLLGGNNGKDVGFVTGQLTGKEAELVANFRGNPWWTSNPSQVIQYASCHDNYTLIDKLVISTGASDITIDIISMNNLAAAIYMTSAGIPFIHAGEEMLREKLEEGGGRCENSYNAPDEVNKIRWDKLKDPTYAKNVAYYQGLIAFRNEHPALRYDTASLVSKNVRTAYASGNVVAFFIDGHDAADGSDIFIIFNANSTSASVSLPAGSWTINVNKNNAGISSLGTASGSVTVDGISAMILTKKDEGSDTREPAEGDITLYFSDNQSWGTVYAYAWYEDDTYPLGAWPGTEMTYVETNTYNESIYSIFLPADVAGVIFSNGNDIQTVDITNLCADGTGFYCLEQTDKKWTYGTYAYAPPTTGLYEDHTGIQNGVTLHCWNWSFAEIERNMALIAEMGFTAIQTSPVQPLKETTTGEYGTVEGKWWVYYQPIDFVITTADGNALGTKTDLESMIQVAHQHGIKVIVDVVANHLANQSSNDLSDQIPSDIQNNSDFWHDYSKNTQYYNNRYEVTQYCMAGLPDLNTGSEGVQSLVLKFLQECIDIGVDGFRFDAAKHIETPDDDASFASDFWPTVLGGAEVYAKQTYGKSLYFYGEVLDDTTGVTITAYTKYMSVTDNTWGNALRESIAAGNVVLNPGYNKATLASNLVLWAESHDTFANEDNEDDNNSQGETSAQINMTWALIAARADAMGLYLARPDSMDQALGLASKESKEGWNNPVVAAVNKFHNAYVGQGETLGTNGNIAYVVRGNSGIVLVNAKGGTADINFSVPMADGVYKDQITGNTFTVENGRISGAIDITGIAVVYNNAVAEIDGQSYATLEDAIKHATQGDTIKLLKDFHCNAVELLKGITLDLNGNTLTVASHVAAFDGNAIIDKVGSGVLKVNKSYLMLQSDNGYLPIWNGSDGYTFTTCKKLNQQTTNTSSNSLSYEFLPAIGTASYQLLAAGAENSGVTMKVVVSWAKEGGTTGSITFTYADSLLEQFFNSYNPETGLFDKAFELTLSGIEGKALTFQVYFESDTGVLLNCGN